MNLASILFARFNAPNDSFDVAPTRSTVVKLLEAEHFGLLRPGLETGFGACLERFDMTAQDRGWRNSADEVETVRPAEVDGLGAPIMDVGAGGVRCCDSSPRAGHFCSPLKTEGLSSIKLRDCLVFIRG
jgi:hypothetical protein